MVLKYDDAFETTTSGIGKGMEGLLIGSPFMGCIIDALLLGVIFCQITHWLPNIRYDPRHVCILVGWAAVAAVGGTIYSWVHWMNAIVYHFGSYSRFFAIDSMGWYGLLDGLVVVPVQLVFIERAVRINGNSCIIGAVTILLTIATGALGMTFLIMTRGHSVLSVPDSAVIISACWPAVCTLTHITITGCIVYGLHKSRSESKSADKLISRLMSVSIESQLPSSVVAVILLAVIVSDPRSPFIPFIAIVHPKVFLIGMLAMVNLRHSWRNSGKTPSQYESSHGAVSRKSAGGAPGLSSRGTTHEGSSLDTPRFGSPRTDEIRPYSSSGRLAPGIEDECGMVELEQKNVSKEDLESGIDPFHY